MATVVQFVDAISSSPGVRFDFNDGDDTKLQAKETLIGAPSLNRAMGSNFMRDGAFVSSSQYGLRSIQLTTLVEGAADSVATTLQTLMRELDRQENILKWHPNGATKPVFFKTFRTPPDRLDMTMHAVNQWRVSVTVLAEPFALGLRETLGPFTVNNDPAAGSNGHFFDVTGVIGDAAVPFVIHDSTASRERVTFAVRQHGTPSDLAFVKQCESMDLLTDTTNPGGGPDAVMSGTGTNNYARTSFATTATMAFRLEWDLTADFTTAAHKQALAGTYNVYAVVRVSSLATSYQLQMNDSITGTTQTAVDVPVPDDVAERMMVRLGTLSLDGGPVGYDQPRGVVGSSLMFSAKRVSGAGTLDWDYVLLLPADETTTIVDSDFGDSTSIEWVLDGVNGEVRLFTNGGSLFTDAMAYPTAPFQVSGAFPHLVPNQTNRLYVVIESAGGSGLSLQVTKSISESLTLHYWPRYLYIRPSAT